MAVKNHIMEFIGVIALSLITSSCRRSETFLNPFDPNVTLSQPRNLKIEFLSASSAVLGWNPDSQFVTPDQKRAASIIIEESTDGINYVAVDSVSAMSTSTAFFGNFNPYTNYSFRIRFRLLSKESTYSSTASGTPSDYSPYDLSIESMTPTSVTLSWQERAIFENGFDIEMSTDGGMHFSLAGTADSASRSTSIAGVFDSSSVYCFRIRATSSVGYSLYSDTVGQSMKGNTFTGIQFVYVQGGTFLMGSPDSVGNPDEHPQHQVTLSSYYIGKYEVTINEWNAVVNWKLQHDGSSMVPTIAVYNGQSGDEPVTNMPIGVGQGIETWISYLNEKESTTKYRLPTEAEWELAARGGNQSKGYTYSGSDSLCEVAWAPSCEANLNGPMDVGLKKPNELGIYDMSGNVMEICSDWYGSYSAAPQTNPTEPAVTAYPLEHVARGGCYTSIGDCRVTARFVPPNTHIGQWWYYCGFRLTKEL